MEQRNLSLTKEDYLIILGDWGVIWSGLKGKPTVPRPDSYLLHWYAEKPWTTIVVLGNHENYDAYDQLPLSEWNGAQVWRLAPNVIVVKSGEVFTLNDKTFLVIGGANSIDRLYRINHLSWWKQELPTQGEVDQMLTTVEAHGYKFDYLLTHCAPTYLHQHITGDHTQDILTDFLQFLMDNGLEYVHHYFGHYHMNQTFKEDKATCLWNNIVELI